MTAKDSRRPLRLTPPAIDPRCELPHIPARVTVQEHRPELGGGEDHGAAGPEQVRGHGREMSACGLPSPGCTRARSPAGTVSPLITYRADGSRGSPRAWCHRM